MPLKELLSALAMGLTILAFGPYIWDVLKGRVKPHLFSWLIWGSTTFVVFLAQLAGGGGLGAWPIGLSGVITLGIAALAAVYRGERKARRLDWVFLGLAATSLPAWALTNDPFWAVAILTLVDLCGFGPTWLKAYHAPWEEQARLFAIMGLRNLLAAWALEVYSPTTLLFPVAIAGVCLVFLAMLFWRRAKTPQGEPLKRDHSST